MNIPNNLKELAKLFDKTPLFITGKTLKNFILNEKIISYDIASILNIDKLLDLLTNTPFIIKVKNAKINTATIYCDNEIYNYYSLNSINKKLSIDSVLKQDISNKNFTYNAIYYNINENEIIDFYNFRNDIENKIIRLNYAKISGNDIFEAIEIHLKQGFSYDEITKQELCNNAKVIIKSSKQQRKESLINLLNIKKSQKKILSSILDLNILPYIFSTKLKKNFNNITLADFTLSSSCPKNLFSQAFFIDVINYLKNNSLYTEQELFNYTIGNEGLNIDINFRRKIKNLNSALKYNFNNSNYTFFIYLYSDIIPDFISLQGHKASDLETTIENLKNKNIPTTIKNVKITKSELSKLYPNKNSYNIQQLMNKIFLLILNEKIENNKTKILEYIKDLNN